MKTWLGWLAVVCAGWLGGAAMLDATTPPAAPARIEYNRDIRPILAENCFACHGPDSGARKADLRLDRREDAIAAGVLEPGQPEASALIARLDETSPSKRMPPPSSHKKLTPEQKEKLRQWVAAGAEYQPHWAFVAPVRPQLPVVNNTAWVRNPIDHFILARLESAGLRPAPEADRRTLIRRVSLDLIGLPPSPQEVETLAADPRPDWYERYVDQLLSSPHWGEHRGRYWLDAARYADTHGIHFDNYREIWAFRDWVIEALNRNMPFDQFTIEQLAGDLLPQPTLEQRIATGFHRCNITTNEGGAIDEEYAVLYTRDRVETTAQVWLGLTAGCAVCHDHKYDPVSMKDFYSMAAFFHNTTQRAMDGNVHDTPPVVVVPRPEDRSRWEAVTAALEAAQSQLEARKQAARADFDRWQTQTTPADLKLLISASHLRLYAPLAEAEGSATGVAVDGEPRAIPVKTSAWSAGPGQRKAWFSDPAGTKEPAVVAVPEAGDFDTTQPFTVAAWVKISRRGETGAIVSRFTPTDGQRGWDLWHESGAIGAHLVDNWDAGGGIKIVGRATLQGNPWLHVCLTWDGSGQAAGLRLYFDGVPQTVEVKRDNLRGSIRVSAPLRLAQRENNQRLSQLGLQDLRLYDRALPPNEVAILAGLLPAREYLAHTPEQRQEPQRSQIFSWWLQAFDPAAREAASQRAQLQVEATTLRSRGTVGHVMQDKPGPLMAHILHRGEYDQRRDPVTPATPAVLPPFPPDLPKNRLGLAHWLLRPEQPLTSRVTVNRFWQEAFGTGLVKTSGDFGIAGEPPSHPELLDWLAVEFRESGWDVKRFWKLLVTSATYRQSARADALSRQRDPDNRLLSRGPRFRMDAEMIRDAALAASGLLVRQMGGPSVKPYQPEGVWEAVAMPESNTRRYVRDTGDKLYRRSLYTFWKRAAPPALLDLFNAPNRETCVVRRERTNTPLQALATLNDVQFVEAARVLAQQVLHAAADDPARLDALAVRVLARPFRAEERAILTASLTQLLEHYRQQPEEAKKLLAFGDAPRDQQLDPAVHAAWTMLANQVLNLDEALCK